MFYVRHTALLCALLLCTAVTHPAAMHNAPDAQPPGDALLHALRLSQGSGTLVAPEYAPVLPIAGICLHLSGWLAHTYHRRGIEKKATNRLLQELFFAPPGYERIVRTRLNYKPATYITPQFTGTLVARILTGTLQDLTPQEFIARYTEECRELLTQKEHPSLNSSLKTFRNQLIGSARECATGAQLPHLTIWLLLAHLSPILTSKEDLYTYLEAVDKELATLSACKTARRKQDRTAKEEQAPRLRLGLISRSEAAPFFAAQDGPDKRGTPLAVQAAALTALKELARNSPPQTAAENLARIAHHLPILKSSTAGLPPMTYQDSFSFKGQVECSDCAEATLKTLCDALLYDPITQQLSLDCLPQAIRSALHDDFRNFHTKHGDINAINQHETGQEWFNLVSGIPGIRYVNRSRMPKQSYELDGSADNLLGVLNHLLGTRAATWNALGALLSTKERAIATYWHEGCVTIEFQYPKHGLHTQVELSCTASHAYPIYPGAESYKKPFARYAQHLLAQADASSSAPLALPFLIPTAGDDPWRVVTVKYDEPESTFATSYLKHLVTTPSPAGVARFYLGAFPVYPAALIPYLSLLMHAQTAGTRDSAFARTVADLFKTVPSGDHFLQRRLLDASIKTGSINNPSIKEHFKKHLSLSDVLGSRELLAAAPDAYASLALHHCDAAKLDPAQDDDKHPLISFLSTAIALGSANKAHTQPWNLELTKKLLAIAPLASAGAPWPVQPSWWSERRCKTPLRSAIIASLPGVVRHLIQQESLRTSMEEGDLALHHSDPETIDVVLEHMPAEERSRLLSPHTFPGLLTVLYRNRIDPDETTRTLNAKEISQAVQTLMSNHAFNPWEDPCNYGAFTRLVREDRYADLCAFLCTHPVHPAPHHLIQTAACECLQKCRDYGSDPRPTLGRLLPHGLNPLEEEKYGCSPAQMAAQNRDHATVTLLLKNCTPTQEQHDHIMDTLNRPRPGDPETFEVDGWTMYW